MSTDCVVFETVIQHPRVKVWQLVGDQTLYPRFFRGITECVRIGDSAVPGDRPVHRFHIAFGADEVMEFTARTVIRRKSEKLVLAGARDSGSWVSINLADEGPGRTRLALVFFKPAIWHPKGVRWGTSEIRAWARDGVRAIVDYLDGAPTSTERNRGESGAFNASVARVLMRAGVVELGKPLKGVRQLRAVGRWGHTLVGGFAAAAASEPQSMAVIDARNSRTFRELDDRTTRLASGLRALGIGPDTPVGVMARNNVAMVETVTALGKLGVNVLLLNIGLAAQQIVDAVVEHELTTVIADDEFLPSLDYLPSSVRKISTTRHTADGDLPGIDDVLLSVRESEPLPKPKRAGTLVVMTSGTTGVPKGARRPTPRGLGTVAAMLSRIPLRRGERIFIAAPLFHSWGLAALQISTPLHATVVLRDRFDPEACLRAIAEHRCTALFAIPIMLQRILNLPDEVLRRYDTSCLRIVASSGSAMSGAMVSRFMDTFGDILYNFYGSTEVSWASVADPGDLRATPTTAGKPPLGTSLGILDDDGVPVPRGAVGRIFIGNDMLFDGYTDGGSKDVEGKLMDTGDLGYLDANGRLSICGRQDEMIISGGENVFPRSVEEMLAFLPQVKEVAVVGVNDVEWGQRLVAYLVLREGARLDVDMVCGYIHHRLARFAVPREVVFLDELPRNPTGKILKRLLVEGEWLRGGR